MLSGTALSELCSKFDDLYRGIFAEVCANCLDHDCEGYVWLLQEEADVLLDLGVPIVEINEGINFIHSFPEENGVLRVDVLRPPCRLRSTDGRCSIYHSRPLVCRMYPANLLSENGKVMLVLMQDCQFTRQLQGPSKDDFVDSLMVILRDTPLSLLQEIVDAYLKVDYISAIPNGPNVYEVIASFDEILKGGCADV